MSVVCLKACFISQIAELPDSFSKLTQLKILDLFRNELQEIPEQLKSLKNLLRLDLDMVIKA